MRKIFFTIPTPRIKFHLLGWSTLIKNAWSGTSRNRPELWVPSYKMRICEWEQWGRFGGNALSSVESGTDAKNQIELVLPIPCSLPCGECCPGVRLPSSGSSKLCAICQVLLSGWGDSTKLRGGCCPSACRQQDLVEHGFNAFPPLPDTELMLKGKTKTTALKDTWLGLPLPPLDAHWQGGMQAISAETPATRPTCHHHSTAAVYSRTDSLLSVGYGGFFHF